MTSFAGLSAFPITPANQNGSIDESALESLLGRLVEADVDSIGLLGSTGSYVFFTREERRRAIEIAARKVEERTPLLVGIGALRTDEAVKLAQDARLAGASAGLLAPVSYTPLLDDEVFTHFETVARLGKLPLCIYDNPGTTHFQFTPELIGRLSRIDGVVAVKSPAPDKDGVTDHIRSLRDVVSEHLSLGYSVDWHCTDALLAGGETWYSVLGGIFPKPCLAIVRAAQRGDAATARRLNSELQPIWDLFRRFTSLRVVYSMFNQLGFAKAIPQLPIRPLGEEAQRNVATVIRDLNLS